MATPRKPKKKSRPTEATKQGPETGVTGRKGPPTKPKPGRKVPSLAELFEEVTSSRLERAVVVGDTVYWCPQGHGGPDDIVEFTGRGRLTLLGAATYDMTFGRREDPSEAASGASVRGEDLAATRLGAMSATVGPRMPLPKDDPLHVAFVEFVDTCQELTDLRRQEADRLKILDAPDETKKDERRRRRPRFKDEPLGKIRAAMAVVEKRLEKHVLLHPSDEYFEECELLGRIPPTPGLAAAFEKWSLKPRPSAPFREASRKVSLAMRQRRPPRRERSAPAWVEFSIVVNAIADALLATHEANRPAMVFKKAAVALSRSTDDIAEAIALIDKDIADGLGARQGYVMTYLRDALRGLNADLGKRGLVRRPDAPSHRAKIWSVRTRTLDDFGGPALDQFSALTRLQRSVAIVDAVLPKCPPSILAGLVSAGAITAMLRGSYESTGADHYLIDSCGILLPSQQGRDEASTHADPAKRSIDALNSCISAQQHYRNSSESKGKSGEGDTTEESATDLS